MLKATEQEKKRIRESIIKQKKRNIQRFLQQVNETKGSFMNQKKLHFKEDYADGLDHNLLQGDLNAA